MKSILLSIKPEGLAKILNGEKTIEVRKLFRKDYVGWVYLYCSKNKSDKETLKSMRNRYGCEKNNEPYGKVVARFWCDKVEEIGMWNYSEYGTPTLMENSLCLYSCLNFLELKDYIKDKPACAIHISDLEIFDKPKELSEFHTVNKIGIPQYQFGNGTCDYRKLTKAPQNYCYVEGE